MWKQVLDLASLPHTLYFSLARWKGRRCWPSLELMTFFFFIFLCSFWPFAFAQSITIFPSDPSIDYAPGWQSTLANTQSPLAFLDTLGAGFRVVLPGASTNMHPPCARVLIDIPKPAPLGSPTLASPGQEVRRFLPASIATELMAKNVSSMRLQAMDPRRRCVNV